MNVELEVKKIIADQLGRNIEEITLEQDIINDLGADSLDLAEIAMHASDLFKINLDKDLEFVTVGDVVGHINRSLASV